MMSSSKCKSGSDVMVAIAYKIVQGTSYKCRMSTLGLYQLGYCSGKSHPSLPNDAQREMHKKDAPIVSETCSMRYNHFEA